MPYKPRCVNELYIRTPYSFSLRSRARSKNLIKRRNFLFLFPFKGERQKQISGITKLQSSLYILNFDLTKFTCKKDYLLFEISLVLPVLNIAI